MPMDVRYNMKNWRGIKAFSKEVNVSIIYAYEEVEIKIYIYIYISRSQINCGKFRQNV
jgi:hypothetical protein